MIGNKQICKQKYIGKEIYMVTTFILSIDWIFKVDVLN